MFAALQRLELGKPHRKPLFAEVDTISSHMPWNRIPQEIGWNQVGNGSIYNKIPMVHETGAFWSTPPRVQAAYGTSIVYSLNTLTSFVQHYGNKNLVMIVLGDHQPLPIVSGTNSNHDVPISIIAHDPNVLKQIGSWGWNAGLKPNPNAPVWPMSAFRNKFLGRVRLAPGDPVAGCSGAHEEVDGGATCSDPVARVPRKRLAGLDGIRGLAALYVVINHVFLRAFPGYPVDHAPFWAGWFIYGRFAVVVFIVLSGFSLALSPARHGWRLDAVSEFARRRARRILPAYWAALAFSLAVAWLIVPQPGNGVPDAKSVIVNGLLVQNIVPAHSPNAAFWSMAVEAQLYILFPLLLLMVRRRGAAVMLATVAVVVAAVGIFGPHIPAPGHLRDPVSARPRRAVRGRHPDRRDRRRGPGAQIVAVAAARARRRGARAGGHLVAGVGVDA